MDQFTVRAPEDLRNSFARGEGPLDFTSTGLHFPNLAPDSRDKCSTVMERQSIKHARRKLEQFRTNHNLGVCVCLNLLLPIKGIFIQEEYHTMIDHVRKKEGVTHLAMRSRIFVPSFGNPSR